MEKSPINLQDYIFPTEDLPRGMRTRTHSLYNTVIFRLVQYEDQEDAPIRIDVFSGITDVERTILEGRFPIFTGRDVAERPKSYNQISQLLRSHNLPSFSPWTLRRIEARLIMHLTRQLNELDKEKGIRQQKPLLGEIISLEDRRKQQD